MLIHDAIIAADEIYDAALRIMNEHGVEAEAVPLIAATAMQRLDAFAIGAMARKSAAHIADTEDGEGTVDDGEHPAGD